MRICTVNAASANAAAYVNAAIYLALGWLQHAAHYFPRSFHALRTFSPRAAWAPRPDRGLAPPAQRVWELGGDGPPPPALRRAVDAAVSWAVDCGSGFVCLKDYVKSAKAARVHGGFLKLRCATDADCAQLLEACRDFADVRGAKFNVGWVLKEWVPLATRPALGHGRDLGHGRPVSNEWRLFVARASADRSESGGGG
eukprot:SAG22_NODE_4794_length_1161_cov_1.461394_1_plen_197_part_01